MIFDKDELTLMGTGLYGWLEFHARPARGFMFDPSDNLLTGDDVWLVFDKVIHDLPITATRADVTCAIRSLGRFCCKWGPWRDGKRRCNIFAVNPPNPLCYIGTIEFHEPMFEEDDKRYKRMKHEYI